MSVSLSLLSSPDKQVRGVRCDLPGKKLQSVIELMLIVLSDRTRPVWRGVTADNSLIWRRWVNISKRAITVGAEMFCLFEVVRPSQTLLKAFRERSSGALYVLIPGAKSLVSKVGWQTDSSSSISAGRSCSLISPRCDTFGGQQPAGTASQNMTSQHKKKYPTYPQPSPRPSLGCRNPILFAVIKYLKITNKVCYETEARTVG